MPCHPSWISPRNGYYPIGRILPETTDSEETLAQVQEWLKDCTTTHSRCGPGAAVKLPTRVLDLGSKEMTGTVRLVETEETSTLPARYACLSHCWGGKIAETGMATTETLKSMKAGILIETLPRSFQDAVQITKRLGLQYLWIDFMCILQDDDSDWDRESSRMASIYQGAFITIGATCSRNSTEGFIRSLNPDYTSSLASSKYRTVDGRPFDLYVRKGVPHFTGDDTTAHPLLGRAWIYQEFLLSPRFLHFAEEELVWECNENSSCQCMSLPNFVEALSSHYWRPGAKNSYSKLIHSKDPRSLAECWRSVVGRYNQLALTFEGDRFRAIAGIADQLSAAGTKLSQGALSLGRYIEGLWENSIVEDLCWSTSILSPIARRANRVEWRAPTWSWASVQDLSSEIDLEFARNKTNKRFAEVLEFGYTNHPSACQKYVRYNYIRLKLHSTWEITLNKESDQYYGLTWWLLKPEEGELPMGIFPDYSWDNPTDEDYIGLGSKAVCGLLLSSNNVGAGLLLVQVDAENGFYRRIGTFRLWLETWQNSYSQVEKEMVVSLI